MSISAILNRPSELVGLLQRQASTRLGADAGTRAVEAVHVSLSKQAHGAVQSAPEAATQQLRDLRDELSTIDFHHVTPRRMAELGVKLFARGEISDTATTSFIGIEQNLVDALDPDAPIDVVAHFDRMLKDVANENEAESGAYEWGVQYRQIASRTLVDIMTYASSSRLHVTA
jgi:hypothetical protein